MAALIKELAIACPMVALHETSLQLAVGSPLPQGEPISVHDLASGRKKRAVHFRWDSRRPSFSIGCASHCECRSLLGSRMSFALLPARVRRGEYLESRSCGRSLQTRASGLFSGRLQAVVPARRAVKRRGGTTLHPVFAAEGVRGIAQERSWS